MRDYRIIAVDFDGTLSCNAMWPTIGSPNEKLIACLKTRKEMGGKILLDICKEYPQTQPKEIGSYRGFQIEIYFRGGYDGVGYLKKAGIL